MDETEYRQALKEAEKQTIAGQFRELGEAWRDLVYEVVKLTPIRALLRGTLFVIDRLSRFLERFGRS